MKMIIEGNPARGYTVYGPVDDSLEYGPATVLMKSNELRFAAIGQLPTQKMEMDITQGAQVILKEEDNANTGQVAGEPDQQAERDSALGDGTPVADGEVLESGGAVPGDATSPDPVN